MLGYVTIQREELKIREYDVYQAYYCGICKSIGRRFGQLPRMTLSYDAVFLALVLSCMTEKADKPVREHCIIHPIKKKPVLYGNSAVDYSADVMVILAYHKFADDWKDEKSPKGFAGKTALRHAYKKLYATYPVLCQSVEASLERLSALEAEKSPSIDLTAGAFADIMESLFTGFAEADGFTQSAEFTQSAGADRAYNAKKRILGSLGRSLGSWIYVIDALDDYPKDKESGSYNPLIYRKKNLEGIGDLLYNYLAEMTKAYDLLNIKKNQGLIENIMFMGMRQRTDALLSERTES